MKKISSLIIICCLLTGCCTESVVYPSVIIDPQHCVSNDVKMVSTQENQSPPKVVYVSPQPQTIVYTQPSVTYVDPTPFIALTTTALTLLPLFIHHHHGHPPPPPPHW